MKAIQEYNTIIKDLQSRNCETAFQWCQTNKSKLTRINSQFEIKLVYQEFIELIKQNETDKALQYLRKYPILVKNQNIGRIQRAMGCLTFYKQLDRFPDYKADFEEERWDDLISMFKHDSFQVSGITTQSNLEIALQVHLINSSYD